MDNIEKLLYCLNSEQKDNLYSFLEDFKAVLNSSYDVELINDVLIIIKM